MALLFVLIFATLFLPAAFRAIYRIKQQETFLGFSFDEEMQKNYVKELEYKSQDWFIDVKKAGYLAVWRRDYIVALEKHRKVGRMMSQIIMITADGRKKKIKHAHKNIIALEAWFSNSSV